MTRQTRSEDSFVVTPSLPLGVKQLCDTMEGLESGMYCGMGIPAELMKPPLQMSTVREIYLSYRPHAWDGMAWRQSNERKENEMDTRTGENR